MAGLLDFLSQMLGGSQSGQPAQPAGAPPQQAAPLLSANDAAQTGGFPDQAAWMANHIKAMGDLARSRPVAQRGLINLFTGRDANAAREAAQDTGPADYFKQLMSQPGFTQADTTAKEGQLGLIQHLGQAGLVTGKNIDPNNIPASAAPYAESLRAQFPDLVGGGQPPAPGAPPAAAQPPVSAAPLAAPQGAQDPQEPNPFMSQLGRLPPISLPSQLPAFTQGGQPPVAGTAPASPASALEANRNYFDRIGKLQTVLGNAKAAADYFNFARQGIPAKNAAVVNGRVVEGVTGAPLAAGMTGQQFDAQGAGLTSAAEEGPKLRAKLSEIGAEDAAKRGQIVLGAQVKPYDVFNPDTNTQTTTNEFTASQTPGLIKNNDDNRKIQDKEIEAAQQGANEASQGIIQAQQLANAAKAIKTGAWGEDIQNIRRGLSSLGIGGDAMKSAATAGDVVNEIGLELAALRARASSSGRTALGTLNAFRSVKPGLQSTDVDEQIKPIIAGFQRQVDYANFANQHYRTKGNWNKLDAATEFQKANPDQKYVDMAIPKVADKGPGLQERVDEARRRGLLK